MESAVSPPAVATRQTSESEIIDSAMERKIQQIVLKTYSFSRRSTKQIDCKGSSRAVVTWRGTSLCMDRLMQHLESYGACQLDDWISEGDSNEVTVDFQNALVCAMAARDVVKPIKDEKGKAIYVYVSVA